MKRNLLRLTAAAAWLTAASLALGQDMAELDVDHALTNEVPTPHTDWAQPYAQGKTRVLFFTNGRGTTPRECVELLQRFDIDAEAVFWARIVDSTEEHWHGGSLGEERMLKLLEQPWDCYVFFDMPLTRLSAEQQVKVLKPVSAGAGLVIRGTSDERIFKDANRMLALPPLLQRGPAGDAYTIGQGRGVLLPKQPDIPYAEGWEVHYDCWAEQVGRAILWAAGKTPTSTLNLSLAETTLRYGDTPTLSIATVGSYTHDKLTLRARLRRPVGPVLEFPERQIRPGRGITFRIPLLPAGDYLLDAWIQSANGIETWDSAAFTIASQRTLTEPELRQDWGEVGDAINGTVTVQGFPYPNERIRINLRDRRRRVLKREDFQASGERETVTFSLATEPWMPMLITVEAQLLGIADEEICSSTTYFNLVKRHQDRFNFLMWDLPKGTLAPYAQEMLAKTGVTVQLSTTPNPPAMVRAFDITMVPYTTRILANLDAKGIMKPFCWNDSEAVAKHIAEKVATYTKVRQHGAFAWSLGDEVHTRGACASPHCAQAYRDYLQTQYTTLDALNRSWKTTFTAWEQVGLTDPADNDEATALREGNYPRWFDRQAFQSYNFVQFCGRYREAYEALDPGARVGFEGAGRFDRGDDIDLIVRHNTFWAPYPGTADEVIRSIAPREFPRANWMGYTKDADSLLQKYWRMITRGMDSVWWWRWDCIGRFHGWLAPDFRPFPAVQEILRDTEVVRAGLGDLLLQADMQTDAIAMLYSYPSSLIHKQENGSSFGGYESAHTAAHTMVRDLGFQFRYVTDRMLRRGEADPASWRLLILPRAEAMSDAEVAMVKDFVQKGGCVIADVRTAIFDHHCSPRENGGALDALFGIRRTGLPTALVAKDTPYGTLKLDPGIQTSSGTAAYTVDGCPAFVTQRSGRGLTLFLNADFSSFPNFSLADTAETHANELALQLAEFGLIPEYTVLDEQGRRARNVEITRWQNGTMELVSLFRSGGAPSKVTVLLPREAVVHDLKQRQALGKTKRFDVDLRPNRAAFFAIAPEKLARPSVTLADKILAPGSCAKAVLAVPGAAETHALRLTVSCDGTPLEWLDQVTLTGADGVAVDLPIAFNDPRGTYTVKVVDVLTNQNATTRFRVK